MYLQYATQMIYHELLIDYTSMPTYRILILDRSINLLLRPTAISQKIAAFAAPRVGLQFTYLPASCALKPDLRIIN